MFNRRRRTTATVAETPAPTAPTRSGLAELIEALTAAAPDPTQADTETAAVLAAAARTLAAAAGDVAGALDTNRIHEWVLFATDDTFTEVTYLDQVRTAVRAAGLDHFVQTASQMSFLFRSRDQRRRTLTAPHDFADLPTDVQETVEALMVSYERLSRRVCDLVATLYAAPLAASRAELAAEMARLDAEAEAEEAAAAENEAAELAAEEERARLTRERAQQVRMPAEVSGRIRDVLARL